MRSLLIIMILHTHELASLLQGKLRLVRSSVGLMQVLLVERFWKSMIAVTVSVFVVRKNARVTFLPDHHNANIEYDYNNDDNVV
mmetsp:Transcript_32847/g.43219  ORF Transcript_32847/g.43219 Transcript_32847/m.43219 type:complete len:84 (+) Transcript_32847:243-494(+)